VSRAGRASWSLRQRLKNDAIYTAAVAALKLTLAMPRGWLPAFGALMGRACYALLPAARRTALANLALVHPDDDPGTLRAAALATFTTLGRDLADTVALLDPRESPRRTLRVPDRSYRELAAALAEQRGVVYVTCHLGPWERMAALLADLGFPITTLARESYDRRFHALVYEKLRTSRNVEAIYRGHPGAAFAMMRALRRGRVLGFLMDLPGSVPTRPTVLMGRPSRLPLGPARVALRARSPVVVGTPAPGPDGTLEVRIARLPTQDLSDLDGDEERLTQRIADALSDRIRALPHHWPWMHPSFENPPGSSLNSLGRFA
jgi:KDO2-lipid IV(A) lauroyltransferase